MSYWYEGKCARTGEWLRLPRTQQAEACARKLMQELANDEQFNREGKMYGVLLVESPTSEQHILKAFSGLLNGESVVEGWVPPIPGRATVAFEEAFTLSQLDAINQELIALQQIPERSQLATLTQHCLTELQQLAAEQQQRKQLRQHQRQVFHATLAGDDLQQALEQLNRQSQQDGSQRRQLKTQHHEQLQPLQQVVRDADSRIHTLKQQRKQLSKQLQEQMYRAYQMTNFAGQSVSLHQLMPHGLMPTGTGDCCAPKLLHYAASRGWKPLAMAEFWWGPPSPQDNRIPGEFYGACRDRCQPLMGFLLSGLGEETRQKAEGRGQGEGRGQRAGFDVSAQPNVGRGQAEAGCEIPGLSPNGLPILYEDEWVVVVDKPAGLLSVPGRYHDRQDSVLSRLRSREPDIRVVHRLDQDTSGILLLAKDLQTYRHLSQQFEQRQAQKMYEAVLAGTIAVHDGVIELPLWGDPRDRPRQTVDWQRGKPSTTKFRVLTPTAKSTRIEFFPLTGRTHQLRVHAADPQGLGVPILGDRLYSNSKQLRLHLHAKTLIIQHPQTGRSLHLHSPVPF